MPDEKDPLLDRLKQEVRRLGDEVRQMADLRWRLARLEIRADLDQVQRLALRFTIAAVMAVVAVSLACVALAEGMERWLGGSRLDWLWLMASVLVTAAGLLGWFAWRLFRRRFTGLQETLEELREDAAWIGEWVQKDERRETRDEG